MMVTFEVKEYFLQIECTYNDSNIRSFGKIRFKRKILIKRQKHL